MRLATINRIVFYGISCSVVLYFVLGNTVLAWLGAHTHRGYKHQQENVIEKEQVKPLIEFAIEVRRGVILIHKKNSDDREISEKIDFERSSEGVKSDKRFNVFSLEGGDVSYLDSEIINQIAPNSDFIFTKGNRVKKAGTELPEVLIVLPGVREKTCDYINERRRRGDNVLSIPSENVKINTDSYPDEVEKENIIELPFDPYGCLKTLEGNYFYQIIIEK